MSAWTEHARLLLLGPGYCARHFVGSLAARPQDIAATAHAPGAASAIRAAGWRPEPFTGDAPSPDLARAIAAATHILVSMPPGEDGDPVLRFHGRDFDAARDLRSIVYLSTVGVYGDHQGGWVDEATPPRPQNRRSVQRLAAETAWAETAQAGGATLAILRLAGIYGPGRNALASLAEGTARRLVKPDQVFNRIHVADIAAAIEAAFAAGFDGIVNVTDDEPAPPQDVVAFAADLMQLAAPPETPLETADLTLMARSFFGESKRVRNDRLRRELGVALAFPTYREGLTALWRSGDWRPLVERPPEPLPGRRLPGGAPP